MRTASLPGCAPSPLPMDSLTLFTLENCSASAAPPICAPTAGAWRAPRTVPSRGVSLEGCPRAVSTSLAPQRLRRDTSTILHAAVSSRDGIVVSALYAAGGALRVCAGARVADARIPNALAWRVLALALSDGARALAAATAAGHIILASVDALLDGAPLFRGAMTGAGLPSLAAIARPSAGATTGSGYSAFAASDGGPAPAARLVPLAAQLAGAGVVGAETDSVTCLAWWTPVTTVIGEERGSEGVRDEGIDNGGSGGSSGGGVRDRADGGKGDLAGRFLLVGHASGRLSIVDCGSEQCVHHARCARTTTARTP